MGLRSAVRSLITRQPVGTYSATKPDDAFGLMSRIFPARMGEPPMMGELDMLRAFTKYPWLRSVTHRVAYAVATTDWQLFVVSKKGKAQPAKHIQRAARPETRKAYLKAAADAGELRQITDHPLLDLFARPNPVLTGIETRLVARVNFELLGNTFHVKERNGAGMVVQLWPIPSYWIARTPTVDNPVYTVSFRGWQGEIPDTEILWQRDPNPENPYGRGRGLAQSLADDIELDGFAAKHMKAWFFNGARPETIISGVGASPEEIKRLEADWNNKNQGFWRAFRSHFINREIKIDTISQTFADQQMIELRQHERDVIRQVWGVPPEVLGIIENSNRATIEAADYLMAKYVTTPRLEMDRAFYQASLCPEFDERLILDYVSPVQEDQDYKLRAMSAQGGAFTIDEWRAQASHGPLEKGEGATLLVPALVTPMDPAELTGPTPTQAPTTTNEGKAAQLAAFGQRAQQARVDEKNLGITSPLARRSLPADSALARGSLAATSVKDGKKHRPLVGVVDRMTSGTAKSAEAILRGVRDGVDHDALRTALAKGDSEGAYDATGISLMRDALNGLTGTMTRAAIAGAAAGVQLLPTGVELKPEDAASPARQWVNRRKAAMLPLMAETSENAVRRAIAAVRDDDDSDRAARHVARVVGLHAAAAAAVTSGYLDGESDEDLDAQTNHLLDARVKTISGNETHAAVHGGAVAAWALAQKQSGTALTKAWITMNDDRVEEECEGAGGEIVGVDESFSNGYDEPPAHAACRCTLDIGVA